MAAALSNWISGATANLVSARIVAPPSLSLRAGPLRHRLDRRGWMTLSGEALIARLPKAELHLHIEGSIEPEMVLDFAERNGIDFPHKSIEALRATYEFDNLAGFGAVYRSNSQVLRTGRDFHDMT